MVAVINPTTVSDSCQEFLGERYVLLDRYFRCYSRTNFHCYLHRAVWQYHHGAIPNGWHVHHINEDRRDNRLDNLTLMQASTHLLHHRDKPETWAKAKASIAAWHRSDAGRAWKQSTLAKVVTLVCAACGNSFKTDASHAHRARYCRRDCWVAAHKEQNRERKVAGW